MEVGTIIRTKHNVHNYPEKDGDKWQYIYYKLSEGEFEVNHPHDGLMGKFNGKHFVCLGSDYWVNMSGEVCGLELLDGEYEIINNVPVGLL